MDGDGRSEWLVWTEIVGNELFFAPQDGAYSVSYPNVDRFQTADVLAIQQLPDNAGSAIAMLRFTHQSYFDTPWFTAYSLFYGDGMGGPMLSCTTVNENRFMPGEFVFWQVRAGELVPTIHNFLTCDQTFESIFPAGEPTSEFHLHLVECADDYCEESREIEVVYHWDVELQTYVEASSTEPAAVATATLSSSPTPTPNPDSQYYDVVDAFEQNDFAAVVALTSDSFVINSDQDKAIWLSRLYLRALALEALSRPDDVLAEYVAIYEAAPESAWGMLAGLHLEPRE